MREEHDSKQRESHTYSRLVGDDYTGRILEWPVYGGDIHHGQSEHFPRSRVCVVVGEQP